MSTLLAPAPRRALIGHSQQSTGCPTVTLPFWDGEASLTLRVLHDERGVVTREGTHTVWTTRRRQVRFYELADGLEVETILFERPRTNVLRFAVTSRGLTWHYQAPLRHLDLATGDTFEGRKRRPASINGSYAVYHDSRSGDYTRLGGQNYKAGKACHVYRPWAEDLTGRRVWGDLAFEAAAVYGLTSGVLTITLPPAFLDTAVYPVRVDPTFGYTTHGASTDDNLDTPCFFFAHTLAASSGTVTDMTCYCGNTGIATNFDAAIYSNNAGLANTRLAFIEPGTALAAGSLIAEVTTTGFSLAITSGVQYWLGCHGHVAGSFFYGFDALSDNANKAFQYNGSGNTFPATALNGGQFPETATLWAIYTAAGGAAFVPRQTYQAGFLTQ